MSSLRAQDPPQQRISGDERDFVTTAEPLRQPFFAVFGPAEPFWWGNFYGITVALKDILDPFSPFVEQVFTVEAGKDTYKARAV